MNRNKRIIDCTPGEIFNLGKQLIDYYIEQTSQVSHSYITGDLYGLDKKFSGPIKIEPQFREGEILCQDQKGL